MLLVVHLFGELQHHLHHIVQTKMAEGPAWANSLFEDNAEYGYGMAVALNK